jgi:type IV secretion system protein VirB1
MVSGQESERDRRVRERQILDARSLLGAAMLDFLVMAQQCAPDVAPQTLAAVAHVESSFNPYAIGVVNGHLVRQPRNAKEAIATAYELEREGFNFSMGLVQVNRFNLAKYGERYETIFDPCRNLKAGASILRDCYQRARLTFGDEQAALRASFSCYYSGNYTTGFRAGYVRKVVLAANNLPGAIPVVPDAAPEPSPSSPAPPNAQSQPLPSPAVPRWRVSGNSGGTAGRGMAYEGEDEAPAQHDEPKEAKKINP